MQMGDAFFADHWIAGTPAFVFATPMLSFETHGLVANRRADGGLLIASRFGLTTAFLRGIRRQADACFGNHGVGRSGKVA